MSQLALVWFDPLNGYAARLLARLGFAVEVAVCSDAAVGSGAPRDLSQATLDWCWEGAKILRFPDRKAACRWCRERVRGGGVAIFLESWPDPLRAWCAAHGLSEKVGGERLVWASLTPYGRGGSPSAEPAAAIFAASGYQSICGRPEGPPCAAPWTMAYDFAAAHAVLGALALVEQRERSGRGGVAEVAARDCWAATEHLITHAARHRQAIPRRGSQHGSASPGRVFPAQDGWVHLMITPASPGHWERFRALLNDPRLDDPRFATGPSRWQHADALAAIVAEHTRRHSRAQWFAWGRELGLPMVPVMTVEEYLQSEHVRGRWQPTAHGLPDCPAWTAAVGQAGATADAAPSREGEGPLAGLRVLDLSHILAGPYATQLLAYLGALVWKVEGPDHPDGFRFRHGRERLEESEPFLEFNRNKRGVTLDLRSPADQKRLWALAGACDVLIENFREGALDRLGITADRLRAVNPRLSIVRIRGLGQGPWGRLPAYGPTVQALCGLTALWNPAGSEGEVVGTQGSPADYAAGIHAALACLAAVRHARQSGRGVEVEVSMTDSVLALLGPVTARALAGVASGRLGNCDWTLGRLRLESDPQGKWWIAAGEGVGRKEQRWPVKDGLDLLRDPQLQQRGFLVAMDHPYLGAVTLPGCPLKVEGWQAPQVRAPFLGEHNRELEAWLSSRAGGG